MAATSNTHDEMYTALIVDDVALIRNIEQMMLKKYGFKTTIVENGQEAINMFNAGNSFDVVLMDMEMPVKNGIQATKELRAIGVKSMIFGVTACESQSEVEAFKAAGLDECFEKPLNSIMIDIILKRLNK